MRKQILITLNSRAKNSSCSLGERLKNTRQSQNSLAPSPCLVQSQDSPLYLHIQLRAKIPMLLFVQFRTKILMFLSHVLLWATILLFLIHVQPRAKIFVFHLHVRPRLKSNIVMKEFAPDIVPPSFVFIDIFREMFEEKYIPGVLIQKDNVIIIQQVDNNNMTSLVLLKIVLDPLSSWLIGGAWVYHLKFQRPIKFTWDLGIDHGVIWPRMVGLHRQVTSMQMTHESQWR